MSANQVLKRRNGLEPACEVCRKAKLSCDHGRPHCARCVRRNLTSRCFYHPNPMTKSLQVDRSINLASNTSNAWRESTRKDPSTPSLSRPLRPRPPHVEDTVISLDPVPITSRAVDGYDGSHESRAAFQPQARYRGPNHFSSVFVEVENDLLEKSSERLESVSLDQPSFGHDIPLERKASLNNIESLLRNIPSRELCESLLDNFESSRHILMNPTLIKHSFRTLWSDFGNELSAPRTPDKLRNVVSILFKNQEAPLQPAPDDGIQYLNTFLGRNLRFEGLGLSFVFLGRAFFGLQDGDARLGLPEMHGLGRKEIAWRMKECADTCLQMCEISETNNEISVSLMRCTAILESLLTGDETFRLTRRHADAVTCAIMAGLHRLDLAPKVTPALEYKRRVFSSLYLTDKTEATFNGIPMSLSKRFCSMQIPLDIDESELFVSQEAFADAIGKLDPGGWNQKGALSLVTTHRGSQLLARCQEDILDIALGVNLSVPASRFELESLPQPKGKSDQTSEILQCCQQVYNSLPPQCHYHAPEDSSGSVLLGRAYLRLQLLQNKFLIDRAAIARGFPNDQRLYETAAEMLELSTMYWVKRDQLTSYYNKFDWIVTCYGIPGSGVICVELLKQARGESTVRFSRSDAIQKLTMFLGFLEWIRPTDGNYLLAGRLLKKIRTIVNFVLDAPQDDLHAPLPLDPIPAMFDIDLDWMGTIDWTQAPQWTAFN